MCQELSVHPMGPGIGLRWWPDVLSRARNAQKGYGMLHPFFPVSMCLRSCGLPQVCVYAFVYARCAWQSLGGGTIVVRHPGSLVNLVVNGHQMGARQSPGCAQRWGCAIWHEGCTLWGHVMCHQLGVHT